MRKGAPESSASELQTSRAHAAQRNHLRPRRDWECFNRLIKISQKFLTNPTAVDEYLSDCFFLTRRYVLLTQECRRSARKGRVKIKVMMNGRKSQMRNPRYRNSQALTKFLGAKRKSGKADDQNKKPGGDKLLTFSLAAGIMQIKHGAKLRQRSPGGVGLYDDRGVGTTEIFQKPARELG